MIHRLPCRPLQTQPEQSVSKPGGADDPFRELINSGATGIGGLRTPAARRRRPAPPADGGAGGGDLGEPLMI
jgi:hypothetical protein